ncbi:MAG: Lrp/AsnC family transcriptional regulator [Gammaproteobacteria bacterium]|jgi:Lrp/AsnC family transcriptional regulator
MTTEKDEQGTVAPIDEVDRKILRALQQDATVSMERLAKNVGVSKTAAWNRVQRMQQHKIILRQAVVVDPQRVGLAETFFISIRTNQHNALWLEHFSAIVKGTTAILEAHRLAGDADYLLKVQVSSTREFDLFYKQLVASIDLYNVTSSLSMEVLKHETALPV